MKKRPESVVVLGGGVIGLSCAYYLARAGIRVTVLDERPAEGPSCSTGNAGMVVPSHFTPLAAPGVIGQGLRWMLKPESPFSLRAQAGLELWKWAFAFSRACTPARVQAAAPVLRDLSLASRKEFQRLRDEEGFSFGLEERGLLALCRTRECLEHEAHTAETGRELGLESRVLDARETAVLEPNLEMTIEGAVYFPQDCHLNPATFRRELIRGLESLGADLHWETKVSEMEREGRTLRSLRDHSGSREWRADAFLIASGVWTAAWQKELGVRLPLQPGKGYSMTLTEPPALPQICALLMEARVAVTPMGTSLRIGGTMEVGGREGVVRASKLRGITRAVPRYLPQFEASHFAGQPVWTGLRPCTPDGLPYLGRCPGLENAYIGAGHAMLGLSLAPVTASLIRDLVTGVQPPIDLRLLDPGRYSPKQ